MPAWILDQWQAYKMSDEAAVEDLVKSRGRGLIGALAMVDTASNKAKMLELKDQIEDVQAELFDTMRPFRSHPSIDEWLTQYQEEHYKKLSRFRSLLLSGGSRTGKTWKALSLFGAQATLKVNCQGLPPSTLPSLTTFDRRRHRCILFDEVRVDQVLGNKEVFQAGAFPVSLSQSNCNAFCYQLWLYQIACVLCSNHFPMTVEQGLTPEELDWLEANVTPIQLSAGQLWYIDA